MREYLAVLMIAWVTTYLVTGPVRQGAIRFGAVTAVRARDVHSTPTPRLGGAACTSASCSRCSRPSKMPMMQTWVFQGTQIVPALLIGSGC
jgi:UDP-GlcNAc:undecaprenyl-phosphate GlcNAc-1-phosphate transferase